MGVCEQWTGLWAVVIGQTSRIIQSIVADSPPVLHWYGEPARQADSQPDRQTGRQADIDMYNYIGWYRQVHVYIDMRYIHEDCT